jgi:hypothetical protein
MERKKKQKFLRKVKSDAEEEAYRLDEAEKRESSGRSPEFRSTYIRSDIAERVPFH